MRASALRVSILTLSLAWIGAVPGRSDEVLLLETADWVPTASVLTVPTSYLVATAAVVPTTSIVPTSYVIPTAYSTAYVVESAYVPPVTTFEPTYYETRFRRRGLFGRRLVETTRAYYLPTTAYYPTTYYYPTVFGSAAVVDRGVVPTEYIATTSTACCGEVIASSAPVVTTAPIDRPATTAPSAPPASAPRSRPSRIESEPDDDSISSEVEPVREAEPATAKPSQAPTRSAAPPPRGNESSPPTTPKPPAREQGTARPESAVPSGATPKSAAPAGPTSPVGGAGAQSKDRTDIQPPSAPSGLPEEDDQLFSAPAEKDAASKDPSTVRRENLKPVIPTTRAIRSEYRNVLVGIVRARKSDEPEDSVQITVTSRTDPAIRKVAMSNAFGKFAVRVPDGDWTVNVRMPSGRVYPVSDITVNNGMIFDDSGRDVPSLIITR